MSEYQERFKSPNMSAYKTVGARPANIFLGSGIPFHQDDSKINLERSRTESRSQYVWPSSYLLHQNDGVRSSKGASSVDIPRSSQALLKSSSVTNTLQERDVARSESSHASVKSIETDSVGVDVGEVAGDSTASVVPSSECSSSLQTSSSSKMSNRCVRIALTTVCNLFGDSENGMCRRIFEYQEPSTR